MKHARLVISCLPLLLLLAAMPASGRLPQADRIPADSIIAVGIDNTAATWKKIEALPLTTALTNYLTTGTMASDLDYQSFLLEQQKLGQKLGYPATPNELMTNVFSSLVVYSVRTPNSSEVSTVAIAGVKDKAKAAKLIEVINQRVAPPAKPTTDTLEAERAKLEKVKIAGIDAWHLSGVNDVNAYYGLTDHGLVAGDNLEAVTAAMGAQPAAAARLNSNAQFNRLRQAINWDQADMSIWYDADAVLEMQPQVAAMLKGLAGKTNKYVITFNVARDGIIGRSVTTSDPAPSITSEQISMSGMKLIGQNPLFAVDYGLFDAKDIVKQVSQFSGPMGAMGQMGDMSSYINSFEQETSVSLQNELAPSLGTELLAAVNNFTPNTGGMVPNIDFLVAAKVKNNKLMQQVMTKLERSIEKQMADSMMMGAAMSGDAPTTPTFQTSKVDGMNIRSLKVQTGMATFTPSYAIFNGYVIMGISPESVQAAGARLQGRQPGLDRSSAYNALLQIAGSDAKPFSFSVIDVNNIAQRVVRPFVLPLLASQSGMDMQNATIIINQIVSRVTTFATMDARQGGLTKSFIKLQMQ